MQRLYSAADVTATAPQFSLESFNDYFKTAVVISQESLSDYFSKLKDTFSTAKDTLLSSREKIVIDSMATRFETLNIAKRVRFVDFRAEHVEKPENFKGKYIDFGNALVKASIEVIPNTEKTLNDLKVAIASFMNEYKDDQVHTLYGTTYFRDAAKLTKREQENIAAFFPGKDNSVKAAVGDLLKSMNDIGDLYKVIEHLDEIINLKKIDQIAALAKEASDLVDLLIEQNASSGILLKNDSAKKDLIEALHIAAREVELVAYLYSNMVLLLNGFKNLTEAVKAFADRS